MENIDIEKAEEEEMIELDDQFILRLPKKHATIVKKRIKHDTLEGCMSIKLNLEDHDVPEATVRVDEFHLYGKLVDLPCIIESTKVVNEINLYKMADISQMLICQKKPFTKDDKQNPKTKGNSQRANNNNINKEENKASKYPHGLAPPLKNARRRRLRKILKNKEEVEQAAEIEKEVFWLLRADNEAVRSRFEIYYENDTKPKPINECDLFGTVISDSDEEPVVEKTGAQKTGS